LSEPVSILLKGEREKLMRSSTHFFRASGVILRDNGMVFNLSLALRAGYGSMAWNGAFMDFDDCGVFCTTYFFQLAALQMRIDINATRFL
jgi:hypothetical protein